MQTLKNILIGLGVLSVILFITFLVIGVKVVSTIVVYVVGGIAVLALIGIILFYGGKFTGKKENDV